MRVRLRLPELMAAQGMKTAYALAKASGGRISMSTAYRLVETRGKLDTYSDDLLETVVDLFKPQTVAEMFERAAPPAPKPKPRKRA